MELSLRVEDAGIIGAHAAHVGHAQGRSKVVSSEDVGEAKVLMIVVRMFSQEIFGFRRRRTSIENDIIQFKDELPHILFLNEFTTLHGI